MLDLDAGKIIIPPDVSLPKLPEGKKLLDKARIHFNALKESTRLDQTPLYNSETQTVVARQVYLIF